jgi:hypothetical protein
MNFRERNREEVQRPRGEGEPWEPGSNLDSLRAAGAEFLQASSDILRDTLSPDSENFLQSNKQKGGQ